MNVGKKNCTICAMNIAIIGENTRTAVWEQHLRALSHVEEVTISGAPVYDGVDGCILISESPSTLAMLEECVRRGVHAYLVSQLPTDLARLEKISRLSEEAGVRVQLSHWPSYSPSTQWARKQITRSQLTQIRKEISASEFSHSNRSFDQHWLDEIGFILAFHRSEIRYVHARPVYLSNMMTGLDITLVFEDSSLASLQFSIVGADEFHQRMISTQELMIDTHVGRQFSRQITVNDQQRVSIQPKSFDPKHTAEQSVSHFVASIMTGRRPDFGIYDAVRLVRAFEKVRGQMRLVL